MILVPTPRRTSKRAGGPGFLTSGFLLAAPSHPSRTVASVPRSLPVTVAGAAPDLHRLPSTHQRWRRGYHGSERERQRRAAKIPRTTRISWISRMSELGLRDVYPYNPGIREIRGKLCVRSHWLRRHRRRSASSRWRRRSPRSCSPLGAGDRVVGVSTYCDYPPEADAHRPHRHLPATERRAHPRQAPRPGHRRAQPGQPRVGASACRSSACTC